MIEFGIVDPTKVTQFGAAERGLVATLLLTTDCADHRRQVREDKAAAHGEM
jgi:chaperonin GroEL (HSP60 family)